jgi:hypothetical protein
VKDGAEALRALRELERACGYPAAYAPLADLIASRGVRVEDLP